MNRPEIKTDSLTALLLEQQKGMPCQTSLRNLNLKLKSTNVILSNSVLPQRILFLLYGSRYHYSEHWFHTESLLQNCLQGGAVQ